VRVYSLRESACNAHAPYCQLWPVRVYNIFPHYLINGTIVDNKLPNTKCVFWFSLRFLSETFLILRRTEPDMIKMYIGLHVKWPLFLSDFNETNFRDRFSKSSQISDFTKIRPVGAELFHADRRTDMTKLIVAFRNYANAPKNRRRSIKLCVKQKGWHVIWQRCGSQTRSKTFCALRSTVSCHIKRRRQATMRRPAGISPDAPPSKKVQPCPV